MEMRWGNGIPDGQDVAIGTSFDCNLNWVPDECELDSGSSADCNLNGIPDECDIASGLEPDINGNGIPDPCECTVSTYCPSAANSSGAPAMISSLGTPSVSDNDLTLRVTSSAHQQFGMFFYGAEQQGVLFGDGMLCIKAPVFRISPVVLSDHFGDVNLLLDFTSGPMGSGPGMIEPFATWNFQYWFRDTFAGGAGFNLSDGLQVTFCP